MSHFDPDAAAAPGSGIFGLPHRPADAGVVLVPVPWEATTSYRGGTSLGPRAILEASRQVDLFDVEVGRPYEAGIALLPASARLGRWNAAARRAAKPVIAAGGATSGRLRRAQREVNAASDRLNDWVHATTREWLTAGKLVGVLGGDHSVPFGAIRAHAERYPGMGVLHLDAHADLRDAYEGFAHSHASIMRNVCEHVPGVRRLVQVGIRDLGGEEHAYIRASRGRVVTHFEAELRRQLQGGVPFSRLVRRVVADLPRDVYLSFDIDGLDPALCPHTGTPVPGGLSFAEANGLLRAVAESGRRIVGLDLCEVAPGPAGDEWDGNVAARLLYKMIGWALRTQRRRASRP